jgi:CUB/sushi domain-containing protein
LIDSKNYIQKINNVNNKENYIKNVFDNIIITGFLLKLCVACILNFITFFRDISKTFIDGFWHHFCATWENTAGKVVMYIDGKIEKEANVHIGYVIPKGALILGQEQDSYMGGFDVSQTYQGNLTGVNIWDRVLVVNEISDLSSISSTEEGHAVKWSDLKTKTFGNVQLICKSFSPYNLPC